MKRISFTLLLFLIMTYAGAQKVRWSYSLEGAIAGAGAPNTYTEGYNPNCAAVLKENKEGKKTKKIKDPEVIKYYFMPFDAQQIVVCENYNAGAIVKIEIESYPSNPKVAVVTTIYEGTAAPISGYRTTNYNFALTKNISCVNIYVDYTRVPGVNQIAGVGLTDFKEKYTPSINLSKSNSFDENIMYMNEDKSGNFNPSSPILTVDGKYIYFSHAVDAVNNQVYRGTIGEDGTISKVELSDFNIPLRKSSSSALTAISQDNNVGYVNDMIYGKPTIYKTYLKRDKKGKTKWMREKLKIKDFVSKSPYLYDCMSYDGKYYILNMDRQDGVNGYYGNDLYVGFRNDEGEYVEFRHMGYDINTIGDEIPCFLAADNKTFVFASSGHLGFGDKDIYITKRLDDTWQNWSQPINLGTIVNSAAQEKYFTIDSKGEYAYLVRAKENKSDLFRVSLHKPQKDEPKVEVIKPDPLIVINGRVLDKKTNEPLQAEIIYTNMLTGEVIGQATSNGETGEYSVALPVGIYYSYLARADDYLPVSENIDSREITETTMIENDLYLVPVEIGQTIRLNNIFFDTGKAILRAESNEELDNVVKMLNNSPKMEIEISGHTDNVGSDVANMKLSDARANAVRTYLIEKGINETRITAKGYGESKPLEDNTTDEGRQINRRVEFTILK